MKTIKEIQQDIIEDFSFLESWDEKYTYLIELGDSMPPMDPANKTEANLVKGCQSSVWFSLRCEDGRVYLEADSDSLIVRGITAILTTIVSGQCAQDLLSMDVQFLDEIGLWKHLSSQRNNGVMAMLGHLKSFVSEHCTLPDY